MSQVNSTGYGYNQQTTFGAAPQPTYNPVQEQLTSPGYVAQFDPYAAIGQGWAQAQPTQVQPSTQVSPGSSAQQSSLVAASSPPTSTSTSGRTHPREYIRTHKAELETWDTYSWKQLLNSFDALKDAWDYRKKELDIKIKELQAQLQFAGPYYAQYQQEGSRLQGLLTEAKGYFDTIAASSFQMREVLGGYRQSGDLASKRRVRESCNAALQGLPDWPQPF